MLPGAQASLLLLLIALIIDLVKRDDAAGSWQPSHFSWRIRSVLWAGVLYVVTSRCGCCSCCRAGSPGCVISLWFLYRIVKGMVRMNAGQADGDRPSVSS